MKVTVIGPVFPYRGGISNFTTSLAKELVNAGHEIQVISFSRQYPKMLYPGQSDKDPSLEHEQVPAHFILDPIYPWTWIKAIQQILKFQPEVVMIQWWTTFWAPAFILISSALRKQKRACVYIIHNVLPHKQRLPDRWFARLALSQAKACITLSPKEEARLKQLLPSVVILPSRLPVPKVNRAALDRGSARQKLGLSAEQPVLIFFGLIRHYKGLSVLLDAIGRLKGTAIQPFLLVVGEFWDDDSIYQQQIERLRIESQVKIINRFVPNEELCGYIGAADAMAAPYLNGTQSAAVKTAMGYGLPILASDQISSDLPLDSHPIFVHKAGDDQDLANSIATFFTQNHTSRVFTPMQDGWLDLISTIAQTTEIG